MTGPSPSWNTVPVFGTWRNLDGTMKPGTWEVKFPVRVTNATDDDIFPAGIAGKGSLNVTDTGPGTRSMYFDCPATDDPDNGEQGWQATVTITFTDKAAPKEVYVISVPLAAAGTGGINLRKVVLPQTLPDPQPVLIKGIPGGIAELDADGDVLDADGNKITGGPGGPGGPVEVDDIEDSTVVGRQLMKAADAAAGRNAISAGTSNLAIGTTGSTAAAGNDSRLSNQRVPTDGSVTNAKIAAGAAIDASKIAVDTDGTMAANSDTRIPSQKSVKMYADQLIAAADAMVFKGVIDASGNPNYPAADKGWTYRISVAGKIGGSSGLTVQVGDLLLCLDDATASGTQAAQGTHWSIAQSNIDGAVIGPASATDNRLALFDGASGALIKDSGVLLSALALKAGPQTVTGTWTFSSAPAVPDGSFAQSKVTGLVTALSDVNSDVTDLASDVAEKADLTGGKLILSQWPVGGVVHAKYSSGAWQARPVLLQPGVMCIYRSRVNVAVPSDIEPDDLLFMPPS